MLFVLRVGDMDYVSIFLVSWVICCFTSDSDDKNDTNWPSYVFRFGSFLLPIDG